MKEKFIKSTIILMVGGLITKALGMFIKVISARTIGIEGIGLFMLMFPTFALFMSIGKLSLPIAISKLVSEERHNNKKILFSALPIIFITNLVLIIVILLSANFIASVFLKDPRVYLPIICIAFTLPFEAISNLLRGYYFGRQKMTPHVISHIVEQLVRLTLIVTVIPHLLELNITYAVGFLVAVNMFSELASTIALILMLPNKTTIKKSDIKIEKENMKNILDISVPTTSGSLVGNIGYFLEPIIITTVLLGFGYSNDFILKEYGIITGFVLPLLLLPAFFTTAISQALLPVISKSYINRNYTYTKNKLKQGLLFSALIGIPITLFFLIFPEFSLKLIYNTTEGVRYMRFLAPAFLLLYIQTPLSSSLQAMGRAKDTFKISLKTVVFRTVSLFLILLLNIGMWGFIASQMLSIIYSTIEHFRYIGKALKG